MTVQQVASFVAGEWVAPDDKAREIACAITGAPLARAGNAALDVQGALDHARSIGGPALRAMTFHDRARLLKALASHLDQHKETLYALSFHTGATQADHLIDIDGGIGTLMVYAAKGRREMPDGQIYLDGDPEQLSRKGSFMGQHVCTPLQGAAIHINAFNFPVWGMLEKLAPALLAGVPAIVKPATASCYVTEAAVRIMLESGLLPAGALQLITGDVGDLLARLQMQDIVSFTGSAQTAQSLRAHPNIQSGAVRFMAEQDSLNASILGPDVVPGSAEFDLFITETHREMTTKAGQKCTAIRRIIAPETHVQAVIDALSARLSETVMGDPRDPATQMGALISQAQKQDVLARAALLAQEAQQVHGSGAEVTIPGCENGAFVAPMLFHCPDPDNARHVHETEAFGPVSTVMGYRDLAHAITLANKAQGALVASVITRDPMVAREIVLGAGPSHGRLYFNNGDSMAEATGHGAPLPHMVHGGPGRAGGGEELGGVRGVLHYMQRTALQGSPELLSAISGKWMPGAPETRGPAHPFRRRFDELSIGETLYTEPRTVTLEDIEHFAHFTGDTFYGHMDEEAARRNPFFPGRVAHGYLLLSFAAGLFVDPDEGPVLANTGLDNLRFMKPISPGESIRVRLSVKAKTRRNAEYGEVRWHVTLLDQDDKIAAEYELLTMNA